jgi:predicted nucleic acid-binding protein
MPRRRIVADASVMLPAFFPEVLPYRGNQFDLTRRAKPIAEQIRSRLVEAFAPEHLRHEFIKRALGKASPRDGAAIAFDQAVEQVREFLKLPIVYVPGSKLVEVVFTCVEASGVSVADGWYLACAMETKSELWISHEHADGLVEAAREHHDKVYLLTERTFK